MQHSKIKRIYLMLSLFVTVFLSACGGTSRPEPESTEGEDATLPMIVYEMDEVPEGGYYIQRANTYEKLYIKNANFDITSSDGGSIGTRTLWYNDDWDSVPTMYKGDMLVYKTAGILNEEFTLERFEYMGYTVGVSGLMQTVSGRYALVLEEEELNINPASDATKLRTIPTTRVIIDKIGGSPLRSGNISSAGLILGLSEGKSYLAEVYQGTYLQETVLTADSIALTSMASATTVDYDFLQSQLISIHFPEHYNSGYYLVNGYGLVRYVNGIAYDEFTDFNIPNLLPEELEKAVIEVPFTIEEDGTYKITLSRLDEKAIKNLNAAVIYEDERLAFENENELTLTGTFDLASGEYAIEMGIEFKDNHLVEIDPVEGMGESDTEESAEETAAQETSTEVATEEFETFVQPETEESTAAQETENGR